MAQRSSFLLAVLLIANPFMILFFQNCSALPQAARIPASNPSPQTEKPVTPTNDVVDYNFRGPL